MRFGTMVPKLTFVVFQISRGHSSMQNWSFAIASIDVICGGVQFVLQAARVALTQRSQVRTSQMLKF